MGAEPRQQLQWRAFALPKRGHGADEYEDAYAGDPASGRFAIADGASESSFANVWAKLLVGGFVHPPRYPGAPPASWLAPLQGQWAAKVDGMTLPWYAEAKREQGAFATFLGVVVKGSRVQAGGTWYAIAVGDSCFFQVRDDNLLSAFPLGRAQDFGLHPNLLGSRPNAKGNQIKPKQEHGKWQKGDRLFLMTDALAEWFLRQSEAGRKPWRNVDLAFAGNGKGPAWIETLRDREGMRNDDVTVVMINL
jgi:hypothetical protein